MGLDGSAPTALLPAQSVSLGWSHSPCAAPRTDVAQFWHLLLSQDLHCDFSFLFTLHSIGLHSFLPSQDFQAGTPLPHAACDQQLSDTTQGKQRTPHFMPQTPVPLGWHCQAWLPVWNRHWPLRITLARTLSFSCFLSISFCKMKAQLGGVWAWHAFLCPSVEQESP